MSQDLDKQASQSSALDFMLQRSGDPQRDSQTSATPAAEVSAKAPTAEQTQPEPVTLAILLQTGTRALNELLQGTIGTIDASNRFSVLPVYKQISRVFELSSGGEQPVLIYPDFEGPDAHSRDTVLTVAVEKSDLPAFVANMLQMQSKQWESLYNQAASYASNGGIASAAIRAERAGVMGGVQAYTSSQGLAAQPVPVAYSTTVWIDSDSTQDTLVGLAATASLKPEDISLVDMTSADMQEVQNPMVPGEWKGKDGSADLAILGDMQVLSSSAEQARRIAQNILDATRATPSLRMGLQCTPSSVIRADFVPAECATDGDDDIRYGRTAYYG